MFNKCLLEWEFQLHEFPTNVKRVEQATLTLRGESYDANEVFS